jgi:heme/copper-type cytochrome/quinol oxidase subunit 2
MNKKTFLISAVCAFAFVSLILNGVLVYLIVKNSQTYQQHQVDKKVLDFRNMFTEKVLLSNNAIDFDTRLSMETAVRALNDPEIFAEWQKFTNSQTQADATAQAKALLQLLIQKTEQ